MVIWVLSLIIIMTIITIIIITRYYHTYLLVDKVKSSYEPSGL